MGRDNVEEPGAAAAPPGCLWPASIALLLGEANSTAFGYLRHTKRHSSSSSKGDPCDAYVVCKPNCPESKL